MFQSRRVIREEWTRRLDNVLGLAGRSQPLHRRVFGDDCWILIGHVKGLEMIRRMCQSRDSLLRSVWTVA